MTNRLTLSFITILFLFTPFSSFGDLPNPTYENLQLSHEHWPSIPAPTYDIVPTREERISNPDFTRFPDWQDMEIIRREKIRQDFAEQVNTGFWNSEISIDSMRDLVVQAFDVFTPGITVVCNKFMIAFNHFIIPFAVDIRYRESGASGVISQGTINTFGAIQVIINDGTVNEIKIIRFDDSQELERVGRSAGFIDQYDSGFTIGIISPLLKNYLSEIQNKEKLIDLVSDTNSTTCEESAD